MEIGDSFLIDDREITLKLRNNLHAAARSAKIAIKVKKIGDTVRVWRIFAY